jgi:hypothetical protein
MGILERLPCSSMVGRPFADYLNVSVPVEFESDVRSSVLSVVDALGNFDESAPGLLVFYRIGAVKGQVVPIRLGTLKFGRRGKVCTISASGAVLRLLRDHGLYAEYLAAIAAFPHRVTMLHATADFLVPDVPAAVQAVKSAAYSGRLYLTRKAIKPCQCQHIFSVDVDGRETGTVYLGQRANADVWAKVYDKRHERLSRGFPEPGSLLRVEIAAQSDVGATLRDALDPTDLFYCFAGRSLVEVPVEYLGWTAHGEGYVLGERRERTLFEQFENLISGSLDIRRLAAMAVQLYGRDVAPQALGRKVVALVGSQA